MIVWYGYQGTQFLFKTSNFERTLILSPNTSSKLFLHEFTFLLIVLLSMVLTLLMILFLIQCIYDGLPGKSVMGCS